MKEVVTRSRHDRTEGRINEQSHEVTNRSW